MRGLFPGPSDRLFYASNGSNVVVLYQYPVKQAKAVVLPASNPYSIFFQAPKTRGRLSCINYHGNGIIYPVDVFPCQGCDAGKPLHEIQGKPFCRKKGGKFTRHSGYYGTWQQLAPVCMAGSEGNIMVNLLKDLSCYTYPCKDQPFLGDDLGPSL